MLQLWSSTNFVARVQAAAIKAPGYSDRRKSNAWKISQFLTVGRCLTEDLGIKLEDITLDDLGRAKRITIDKDSTTIVEGEGSTKDVQGRVSQIRRQIEETTSDCDREKLQERLAKLAGGIAVLSVGAATETEMKEKKARVEDALHATRAAVDEEIVPGGGVALIRAQKALDNLRLEGDEKTGLEIVRRAVEASLRQLAENAGQEDELIVQEGEVTFRERRLRRCLRRVCRPGESRRGRPDESDPVRVAERRLDLRSHAYHRSIGS